jgi:hypothetical protein
MKLPTFPQIFGEISCVHYCQLLVLILSQINAIHTDVLEIVHSLLALFSKLKNNGQREVATAVRDNHINEEGLGTC